MPNARLLHLMMACVVGTILGAAAKPLGTPMVVLASLFGSVLGWVLSRLIVRKLF